MNGNKVYKVEVSAKTIIFTVVFLLFLLLLWAVKSLILELFIAFILMSAVKPLVLRLERRRIPRGVGVALVYVGLIVLFSFIVSWVIPPLVSETALLAKQLPRMLANLNPAISQYVNVGSLTQYIPNITNQAISIISSIFSNVMFAATTLVFSVYFTLQDGLLKKTLSQFFDETEAARFFSVIEKTERRLGAWLLGELFLMFIVGALTFVGLTLIGVKYALPLSLIAGFLEIVPNVGPILSTVPAFIVAVAESPFLGLASIALYFIVQQLENHFIVPLVMRRVIGLNPIFTLIALIVGGQLFGVLGVLLSIPFTLFLETLLLELMKTRQEVSLSEKVR